MGGGQYHAVVFLEARLIAEPAPHLDPRSRVGIGHIALLIVHLADDFAGTGIRHAVTLQETAQGRFIAPIQRQKPLEITGTPHIHGIRNRRNRRTGRIAVPLQKLRHHIVGIRRRNKLHIRHTHMHGQHAGRQVPEIPARHHKRKFPVDVVTGKLRPGRHIVHHLGDESGDVDGIGGGEIKLLVEVIHGEDFLDHTLTVVEGPLHRYGRDIAAEG